MSAGEDTSHILSGLTSQLSDRDPDETAEWIESFDDLVDSRGTERAQYIVRSLLQRAGAQSVGVPMVTTTDYVNTIPVDQEPEFPGDEEIERSYRAWMRWNAAVLVHRAQRPDIGVGGHISTYAGAATLYEVGLNHFFRGPDHPGGGDQVFFQGHASPGMYARAFLEGRLSEEDLDGFRQEKSKAPHGLPSYPHPRLMPEFWQFPTVSMGIGPMNAIYQAQFNRYLRDRGIKDTSDQHVWAFLGDGEMDEPESRGLLQLAANDGLDNLTFVINCNLQRLDGPVRGNGKIVQELEAFFRGAGWNVIKVLWGREWDELLASRPRRRPGADHERDPDGDFQTYKGESGGYVRENFFGKTPPTKVMVADMTDDADLEPQARRPRLPQGVRRLPRRHRAQRQADRRAGPDGQGLRAGHQLRGPQRHPPDEEADRCEDLKDFRDLLHIPITDEQIESRPVPGRRTTTRAPTRPEIKYMLERRARARRLRAGAADRAQASCTCPTTKAYEVAKQRLRQADGRHHDGVRPAAPGPDAGQGVRRPGGADHPGRGPDLRHGLVLPDGQDLQPQGPELHRPSTASCSWPTRSPPQGQILHTGINEAGSMAAFTAAGTSYATHGEPMIPVYVFYSMFGFQRTGDSFWAADGPDGPRLHHRRHRRPDHADRRRPAARRRPLADPGLDQPGRDHLRPGLRLRDRAHRPGRAGAMYGRTPTGPATYVLPDRLQRADLSSRPSPRTSTSRASSRASTGSHRPRSTGPQCSCWPPACRCRGRWKPQQCSPRTGGSPPTSGR